MGALLAGPLAETAPLPIRRRPVPSPAPDAGDAATRAPAHWLPGLDSPLATVSRLRGRDGVTWLTAAAPTIQRTAGNRAVADLVAGLSSPHVQRCGGVDPATCSCHDADEGETAGGGAGPVVARSVAGSPGGTVVQRVLSPDLAQSIARKLEDAMSGWGTDEDAIYGALSGRSAEDIRDIRNAYSDLYSKDLDAELADELDSDELARVKEMMPVLEDESGLSNYEREEVQVNRARVTAERLRSAMQGLGTEEDEIFGALVGRTHEEIGEIKRQYFDLTNGHYLEQDLQDELSGEDLRRAINLIDVVGEFETTGFSDCDPGIRETIRSFVPIARAQVDKAIEAIAPGWGSLDATVEADFRKYFDPGNSGQLDGRFVDLVYQKFQMIKAYMAEGLDFDCDLASGSLCGDGYKWCGSGEGNGRLYWTCFGDLHVCGAAFTRETSDERRWSDIIHESTHNALHTTDRAYCGTEDWPSLTPYGTGALSVLDEIPVIGKIFSLAGGGGDTLNNPDSYSHFAQKR
ncbi:MAG TPA: annexin [Candidatus Limnocylindrales bacterium]|nr:annexin [Candidatus Limnocylindrales bacterium]